MIRCGIRDGIAGVRLMLWAALISLFGLLAAPAQEAPADPALQTKVEELRRLLADPDIRAALAAAVPAPPGPVAEEALDLEQTLDLWAAQIADHLRLMAMAARDLPEDTAASLDEAEAVLGRAGGLRLILSLAVVLGGALAVEALCRRLLAGEAGRLPVAGGATGSLSRTAEGPPHVAPVPLAEAPPAARSPGPEGMPPAAENPKTAEAPRDPIPPSEATLPEPLTASVPPVPGGPAPSAPPVPGSLTEGPTAPDTRPARAEDGLPLFAFTIALVLLYLTMRWPAGLGPLVSPWLLALIFVRAVRWFVTFSFRLPDASPRPEIARFWIRRHTILAAILAGGWALSRSHVLLGAPEDSVTFLRNAFGLVLIVLAAVTIWHHPAVNPAEGRGRRIFLTVWLVVIAVLELAGTFILFWLAVYAVGLPPLLRQVTRIVRGLIPGQGPAPSLRFVVVDRLARAAVIGAAAGLLAWLIHRHPGYALMQDEMLALLIQGALRGVVILLLADLAWQVLKAVIEASLMQGVAADDPVALARNARLRTLLPIFRSIAGIAILAIALMMALSGLGVEIGPLIAGAGIFGVAIGFGSQTLVKDIISGIFYMLDDAFRVGEYIQSGSYKGVVEGFSLRSVRLRHHRGPIYTVPFGSLGAVQNMSRDWSKDKFLITVPFDTDLEKVRKLVKRVGETLQADPEFAHLFIQPMKMKGVESIGDYGMTLGVSMILKPTPLLSMIRRRAYRMIRDSFRDNGIDFASPTVHVAGAASEEAAALALERSRQAAKQAEAAGG